MDTDESHDVLDTLVQQSVTISQTNLPAAVIDREIDDLAMSCVTEHGCHSNLHDDDIVVNFTHSMFFA